MNFLLSVASERWITLFDFSLNLNQSLSAYEPKVLNKSESSDQVMFPVPRRATNV